MSGPIDCSGVGTGGGADGQPHHQPVEDAPGLIPGMDQLRTTMRERIVDYVRSTPSLAEWQLRSPELVKWLEETLYTKFPNKNDYYNMMKGPVEPQLQFAILTLNAQNQQNPQMLGQAAQMNQVCGSGAAVGVGGAHGILQHQLMQDTTLQFAILTLNAQNQQNPQMLGQAAQMNQVCGSGVAVGVGGAHGILQHQLMQDTTAMSEVDQQFVMLRTAMREKIFEYIGRKHSSAEWRKWLSELAKRLEEILYGKFPNKNDYYNMMKGPVEPQLQFAIKTLSAQYRYNQQNPLTRQIASSSGYGTIKTLSRQHR